MNSWHFHACIWPCTVECFARFCFVVKNIGRQDDFANFWHFLTWFQSFLQPNWLYLGLKTQLGWRRLNSCEKMSKICQIILSADVFHNETKPCKTFHCAFCLWDDVKSSPFFIVVQFQERVYLSLSFSLLFHHMQMKKISPILLTCLWKASGLEGELHFHVKTIHKNVLGSVVVAPGCNYWQERKRQESFLPSSQMCQGTVVTVILKEWMQILSIKF